MKKTLLISAVLIFFSLAPHVFAQGFVPLAPIEGLTSGVDTTSAGLAVFFNNLYKFAIGMAAVLAVIMIIWGGLQYATQDIPGAKQEGKDRILQAILGLILVLSPVLVFSIINPSILNLSINLLPLDTRSGTTATSNGSGINTTNTDMASGCTVTGTAGILQIAACPSGTAATVWGQSCTNRKGVLSATVLTNNPDGTVATTRLVCRQASVFEFIDVGTSRLSGSIGRLQPLAIASGSRINAASNGTDAVYPNNGSNAIQFAAVCQSIGWKTCIDSGTALSFSHSCDPLPKTTLPASAPAPAECYTKSLSCEDLSLFDSNVRYADKCSGSPSWAPFQ